MRHNTWAIAIACALLLVGEPFTGQPTAHADKGSIGPDGVRELVAKGELMQLDEILRLNEKDIVGRIIEIELERKSVGYVYEVKVLRPDGRKLELKINGQTGAVISGRKLLKE